MHRRMIVIGCPGAGKSTFARGLRDITGLPLYYLDQIWHRADQTNVTREAFDRALQAILEEDDWIIDGNYGRTLEMRLEKCNAVFLLDYPLEVCLAGARARIGQKREDMPWVEETLDPEFQEWIENFARDQRPHIDELLEKYKAGREIVIFHTREEAAAYLREARSAARSARP